MFAIPATGGGEGGGVTGVLSGSFDTRVFFLANAIDETSRNDNRSNTAEPCCYRGCNSVIRIVDVRAHVYLYRKSRQAVSVLSNLPLAPTTDGPSARQSGKFDRELRDGGEASSTASLFDGRLTSRARNRRNRKRRALNNPYSDSRPIFRVLFRV